MNFSDIHWTDADAHPKPQTREQKGEWTLNANDNDATAWNAQSWAIINEGVATSDDIRALKHFWFSVSWALKDAWQSAYVASSGVWPLNTAEVRPVWELSTKQDS